MSAGDDSEVIMCARYGELEDLIALVDAGENIMAVDANENTALHMSAANGHQDIVEFLLKRMPQGTIDHQNLSGNTALHWAALNGHEQVVGLLLDFGASPQIKNKKNRTPLDEAIQNNHEGVASKIATSPKFDHTDGLPEVPDDGNNEMEDNNDQSEN